MSYYRNLSNLNLCVISFVFLSFFIQNGCGHKEPVLGKKEQKSDDLKKSMENPLSFVILAEIYYAEMGRWPDSINDFEKLNENPVSDIDWTNFNDSIVFEKLPEGGLKIISTKSDSDFSVTIKEPPHFEKSGTQW